MKSIENKVSNEMLNSLLNEIQKRAELISIEQVPDLTKIVNEPYSLKRGSEAIQIPAVLSNELIYNIFQTYILTAFSTDLKLINEVKKKLNLKKNEDWFFNLNSIVNEIQKISALEEVEVNQNEVLKLILDYIGAKICATIINKISAFKDNEPISVERLRNYRDTKNKAKREGRNIIQNNETENHEKVLAIAEKAFEHVDLDNFNKLQAFAKGNCESIYFPLIFNDFIKTTSKVKNGDKLLIVYDLFSYLIRDRIFYTKEEFETSTLSHKNYNAYKKKVIRNILKIK